MSRETYQPPALVQGSVPGASSGQQASGGFNLTQQSFDQPDNKSVKYLCGECDSEVPLKKGDAIRCKECGYRVLYKQRTNRMVQFEAR